MRTSNDYQRVAGYHSFLNPGGSVSFDVFALMMEPYAFSVGFSPFKQPDRPNQPWIPAWSFLARETTTQPDSQEFKIVIQVTCKTSAPETIAARIVIPGADEHDLPDWSLV